MNKTLYQLAYRNIKKHKKHYTFMIVFIFFITIFFHCFTIVQESSYLARKQYNEEHYGMWYGSITINNGSGDDRKEKELIEDYIKTHQSDVHYGYWYNQGVLEDNVNVGYMDKDALELSHTLLKQGRLAQKDNEIMLDKNYLKKNKYQLNQKVKLSIKNNLKEYTIVGIVEKSQDIFPDIYTANNQFGKITLLFDQSLGDVYKENGEMMMNIDDPVYGFYRLYLNLYGYDHKPLVQQRILLQMNTLIFVEGMIICMLVLFAMTSTSLKNRTKEFALLRGIGMTTKQLVLMLFYENVMSGFIAIIVGTLVSPIISYGITYIFVPKEFNFHFEADMMKILLNMIMILIGIIISSLYPAFHSSKTALSGSFDSQSFQYIQIRYRKLKKQNNWRLAMREMRVYKKMTIFLFFIFGLCSYMIMTQTMPRYVYKKTSFDAFHYISWTTENDKKVIQELKNNQLDNDYQIISKRFHGKAKHRHDDEEFKEYNDDNIGLNLLDNIKLFEDCPIEGRLPEKPNEALINGIEMLSDVKSKELENGMTESETIKEVELKVNDTLNIKGKDIKIVGIVLPIEVVKLKRQEGMFSASLWKSDSFGLYVMPEIYSFLESKNSYETVRHYRFYKTDDEKKEIINRLENNGLFYYNDSDGIFDEGKELLNIFVDIPISTLVTGIILSIIVCYFLNKNETMNNMNDYALYRLIGMSKKDILNKQLCKAMIMTLCVLGFEFFWVCIYSMFMYMFVVPIKEIVISLLGTIIISILVYCLPLVSLLKNNAIDIMNKSE